MSRKSSKLFESMSKTEKALFEGSRDNSTSEEALKMVKKQIKNLTGERGNAEVSHYRSLIAANVADMPEDQQMQVLRFFLLGAWTCPADFESIPSVLQDLEEKSKNSSVNKTVMDLSKKGPMVRVRQIFSIGDELLPKIFKGVPKNYRSWGMFSVALKDKLDVVAEYMCETFLYARNGMLKYSKSIWAVMSAKQAGAVLLYQTSVAVKALRWYKSNIGKIQFPENIDNPYIFKDHPFLKAEIKGKIEIDDEEEVSEAIRDGAGAMDLTPRQYLAIATIMRPSLYLNHREIKKAGKVIPVEYLRFCADCYKAIAEETVKFHPSYTFAKKDITTKADFNEACKLVVNNAHFILAKGRMILKGSTGTWTGQEAREIQSFQFGAERVDLANIQIPE